jgi:hypothetical protein
MIANLEIFGSYEASLNESKIMKGHNNINYVVGGNARYFTRSNIIDWNSVSKMNIGDAKIRVINDIIKFPTYIDNHEMLCQAVHEINKLTNMEFLKLLENSLNLKESLVIQLRRLFYIIDKINASQNSENSIISNYSRPIEFCPYEPIKRIEILLDAWPDLDMDYNTLYYNINPIALQLSRLNKKKIKLYDFKLPVTNLKKSTITTEMDKFINLYTSSYKVLHDIENINIEIAKKIEKINDILAEFIKNRHN